MLGYLFLCDFKVVRVECGVVLQLDNFDMMLIVEQNFVVFVYFYWIDRGVWCVVVERALEIVNFFDRCDTIVDKLFGGMCWWLLIARGFVHELCLVLLDELIVGLDL